MCRVLICGGRQFEDVEFMVEKLCALHSRHEFTHVITGGARGADTVGHLWATEMQIPTTQYLADWNRLGKKAGIMRNTQMLTEGKPKMVVAFPGGTGTAHMISIATRAGLPVVQYPGLYFVKEDPEWGFLSNFYLHDQIDDDGVIYPSNEHYYQSQKTLNEKERSWVAAAPTPREAKARGKQINVRSNWELIKRDVMLKGLRQKFMPGTPLSERLCASTPQYLFHYTPWGDTYWGVDQARMGDNWQGRLLMARRGELLL